MLSSALLLVASIVAAQADEPNIPKDAIKAIGYYVGDWRAERTEDGEKRVDEFTVKWVRGQYCTILTSTTTTPKGVSKGTLLSGWDALNKEIVDFSYGSDGSHSIERWKVVSSTVEEATSIGVNADGKRTTAAFRIEKKDRSNFTLTIADCKEGGESKPDLVINYKKIEKPKGSTTK
jgi:hypothetical protein